MKRKLPVNESSSDSDESEVDSDEEVFSFVVFFSILCCSISNCYFQLLEAYQRGEVQPGLNQKEEVARTFTNNTVMRTLSFLVQSFC
jgi:hypothetical protein